MMADVDRTSFQPIYCYSPARSVGAAPPDQRLSDGLGHTAVVPLDRSLSSRFRRTVVGRRPPADDDEGVDRRLGLVASVAMETAIQST